MLHKESQQKKSRTKRSTRKVRFETVVQILRGSIFWIRQLNTRLRGSSTRKGCWRPRRILPVASAQLVGAWLAAAKFQSDWLCATEFQTRSGVQLSTPNETRCTLLQYNPDECSSVHAQLKPIRILCSNLIRILPRCQRNGRRARTLGVFNSFGIIAIHNK